MRGYDRPGSWFAIAVVVVLSTGSLLPDGATAAPLKLDQARIEYSVRHPFKQFSGWIETPALAATFDLDDNDPLASRFSIVLDAAGFTSGNELRDSHQAEQIGLLEYPQVRFMATKLVQTAASEDEAGQHLTLTVHGKLQWHGVLQDVQWPVELVIGSGQVTADASFTLDITEYGMVPASLVSVAIEPTVPVTVHLVFNR